MYHKKRIFQLFIPFLAVAFLASTSLHAKIATSQKDCSSSTSMMQKCSSMKGNQASHKQASRQKQTDHSNVTDTCCCGQCFCSFNKHNDPIEPEAIPVSQQINACLNIDLKTPILTQQPPTTYFTAKELFTVPFSPSLFLINCSFLN